jgi:hypothetical protein
MDDRLKQDALIEDALRSQPLAPMPRSVTANVMAHIQVGRRPPLITWNDFVIAFVIALTIGALIVTFQNLPPIALTKLHIQSILLYQYFLVNMRWLIPATLFGLSAFFAVLTLPTLFKMTVDRRQ